jgi:hypothetical protein
LDKGIQAGTDIMAVVRELLKVTETLITQVALAADLAAAAGVDIRIR